MLRKQLRAMVEFLRSCRSAQQLLVDWRPRMHLITTAHVYSLKVPFIYILSIISSPIR